MHSATTRTTSTELSQGLGMVHRQERRHLHDHQIAQAPKGVEDGRSPVDQLSAGGDEVPEIQAEDMLESGRLQPGPDVFGTDLRR